MWGFESNKHNLAYPMARREVLVKKKKPSVDINFIESSSSSSHDASSEESEASTHVNRLLKSSHSFVGDSDPRISQIRYFDIEVYNGRQRWSVRKRLSQLQSLANWITTNFPTAYLNAVPFPSATLADGFLTLQTRALNREEKLDAWLQQFLPYKEVMSCWEVKNFFGVPSAQVASPNSKRRPQQGVLYVKIVAASNLPTREDGTFPSIMCRASISGPLRGAKDPPVYTPTVNTRVVRHSINPIFNNELLFTITDASVPVRIELWDYRNRSFSKPRQVTHTQIIPKQLYPRKLEKLKLRLNSMKDDTRLIVEARFQPLRKIPKIINTCLPSLRFHVAQTRVYPGTVCEGALIFNVGPSIRISQITLRFVGQEETSWTQGIASESATTIGQTNVFIDHKVICWTSQNKVKKYIDPDCYVWPFKVLIPKLSPPTHHSEHGSITYTLRAEVQLPGFTKTKRATFEIFVLSDSSGLKKTISSNLPRPAHISNKSRFILQHNRPSTSSLEEKSIQTTSIKKVSVPQGGHIRCKVELDANPLTIDNEHKIRVHVTNRSKTIVTDIAVSLICEITCNAHTQAVTTKSHHCTTLYAGPGYPIGMNKKAIGDITLKIPKTLSPSIDEKLGATLITVTYNLVVGFTLRDVTETPIVTEFPVVLAHKPYLSSVLSSPSLVTKSSKSPLTKKGSLRQQTSVTQLFYIPSVEQAIPPPRREHFKPFEYHPTRSDSRSTVIEAGIAAVDIQPNRSTKSGRVFLY